MPTDPPLIQVEITAKFQRNLRTLAKKYRNIRNDKSTRSLTAIVKVDMALLATVSQRSNSIPFRL